MEPKTVIRYSTAYKQQVVRDPESGRFASIRQVQEHYGVGGDGQIQIWLRPYGKECLCPRRIRAGKPDEQDQIRQLKKKIKQLKQALGHDVEAFQKKVGIEVYYLWPKCVQIGVIRGVLWTRTIRFYGGFYADFGVGIHYQ